MQDFAGAAGRLRRLPLGARLVYSVFLLFTLVGLAVSAWLGGDMLGADLGRITTYYAGGAERPTTSSGEAAGGGPQLDLPEDADTVVAEPMALRKLLEVTHFHLFSMPIYLMVLSHLFWLCRWRERSKLTWIVLGSLSVAGHMLAPWLVRARQPLGTAMFALSGAVLAASFLLMTAVPLWEMWAGRSR